MKKILIVLLVFVGFFQANAQELKCEVTVIAPNITNVEKSVFETLESTIRDFMNGRKWTDDTFEINERINCSIQITINAAASQTSFEATIQVQASRPIYMADYNSSLFLVNDGNFRFNFLPNTVVDFSLDQHRDNLSSLLAYYAYMILGYDYDTFSLEGGTNHFSKAQTIVSNAQNASEPGWRASQSKTNRYWMVDYMMSQTFVDFRKGLYTYHRNGLDVMHKNALEGRKEIKESLLSLKKVHMARPANVVMQLYFLAKSDEIINIFKDAPIEEKQDLFNVLKIVDPGNINKYNKMMK